MIRVALIDGPLPAGFPGLSWQEEISLLHPAAAHSPAARHAVQMARAMQSASLTAGAEIEIDNYVVFPGHLGCSLDAVCTAMDRALTSDAQILHCSFGLPRPASRLTSVVNAALAAGKQVVASAAARGERVYPAGYDGVTSVQGDARCAAGTWSWLGLPYAEYGACARGGDPAIGGASVAAAYFTGHLAVAMGKGEEHLMSERAAFHGRERILSAFG